MSAPLTQTRQRDEFVREKILDVLGAVDGFGQTLRSAAGQNPAVDRSYEQSNRLVASVPNFGEPEPVVEDRPFEITSPERIASLQMCLRQTRPFVAAEANAPVPESGLTHFHKYAREVLYDIDKALEGTVFAVTNGTTPP